MKRMYLYLIVMTAMLLGASCEKTSKSQSDGYDLGNRVIPLSTASKEAEYLLTIRIGHLITDCGGRCVTINGTPCHFDCMGLGHVCLHSAAVSFNQVGTTITATTTDTFGLTNQDFFNMPARSLNYTDESNNRIYLNIPAQLIYRDEETQQFTFTGLSFSDGPMYTND